MKWQVDEMASCLKWEVDEIVSLQNDKLTIWQDGEMGK